MSVELVAGEEGHHSSARGILERLVQALRMSVELVATTKATIELKKDSHTRPKGDVMYMSTTAKKTGTERLRGLWVRSGSGIDRGARVLFEGHSVCIFALRWTQKGWRESIWRLGTAHLLCSGVDLDLVF